MIYVAPYKMSADILYYNYLYETGEAEKNHTALPYSGVGGSAAFGVAPPEIPAQTWTPPVDPENTAAPEANQAGQQDGTDAGDDR